MANHEIIISNDFYSFVKSSNERERKINFNLEILAECFAKYSEVAKIVPSEKLTYLKKIRTIY